VFYSALNRTNTIIKTKVTGSKDVNKNNLFFKSAIHLCLNEIVVFRCVVVLIRKKHRNGAFEFGLTFDKDKYTRCIEHLLIA
jgi:hypothetical protein